MKTKSVWGRPPTRLYELIKKADRAFPLGFRACVVGCSDGKFVFPFARKGHSVTGYEIDKTALYGGIKAFPIRQTKTDVFKTENKSVGGIFDRIHKEGLEKYISIEKRDFYKNIPDEKFDVVFTSCSLHYTVNSMITLEDKTKSLQKIVNINGLLYMDYMIAIDESDFKKFPENKFYRTNEILKYFKMTNWNLVSFKENRKPTLEAAHVECPFDHYHRFGYICLQKIRD